jgi:hypothetical protein
MCPEALPVAPWALADTLALSALPQLTHASLFHVVENVHAEEVVQLVKHDIDAVLLHTTFWGCLRTLDVGISNYGNSDGKSMITRADE